MTSACIVGPGAIGGWLAGLLDAGGVEVRLLARGAALAAVREHGLIVRTGERRRVVHAAVSDDPAVLGPVDYVILAVKNQDLPGLAPRLAPLIGDGAAVVTAMNGLQWWFARGLPGLGEAPLASVDPEGAQARVAPVERVIGCVVHATAAVAAPGEIEVIGADKLILGEPDGAPSSRVARLAEACRAGGVETEVSSNIRLAIWRKLWGNMSMNPLSALTRATTGRLLDDPLTCDLVRAMMTEMAGLGDRLGLSLNMTPDQRMAVTRRLGDFKTSMQRDAETGRRLELDALLGVLVEIAARLDQPAPSLAAVYGLARQLDRSIAAEVAARGGGIVTPS